MTHPHEDDLLLLDKQLCFPIYACARKIVAAYHPFLKAIGLTYTQYVTMMVLWEKKTISVRDLGHRLYLDSGTLTPVLKKLEQLGYIERRRSAEDERVVNAILTKDGMALKEQAKNVPKQMGCHLAEAGVILSPDEIETMKAELYKILQGLR
ncbi:MarR family winged helix-turn-helix transcriptional regulator [Mitsuokella sp. AF33-22]|uniref:MarR family winged helix-turn-helix transcriptional regulator n=1 Tax=Mitsuokella sp. AF33-22 TaxID=2292047 RepID=UPI000E4867A7|nr:MarR family transcriptional regulator [Mitsuokella sp. AF33-22]RHM54437.1 MarR family transcriptional regulator [Mitsuokella sp. AF33-22]